MSAASRSSGVTSPASMNFPPQLGTGTPRSNSETAPAFHALNIFEELLAVLSLSDTSWRDSMSSFNWS